MRIWWTARGFTLVEIQIALLILLLMFGGLAGALHLSGKASRAAERQAESNEALRILGSVLRRQMAGVLPLYRLEQRRPQQVFQGERERVHYVGHLPVHAVGGGSWLLRLRRDGEQQLVLDYRVPDGGQALLDSSPSAWRTITLLEQVERLELAYRAPSDGDLAGEWHESWDDAERLPAAIRIRLRLKHGEWLELVLAIRTEANKGLPMHVLRVPRDASERGQLPDVAGNAPS